MKAFVFSFEMDPECVLNRLKEWTETLNPTKRFDSKGLDVIDGEFEEINKG